jgi:diacylglycerol kinase family enzyme
MHKTSIADRYMGDVVEITCHEPSFAHTDGEGFTVEETQVFTIKPQSIKVWVPS